MNGTGIPGLLVITLQVMREHYSDTEVLRMLQRKKLKQIFEVLDKMEERS